MQSDEEVKFPFIIKPLESEVQRKVDEKFQGQPRMVKIGPSKWLMPGCYSEFADTIWNFEVRPSDVFICTFPRSGATWTQEMIWLICNDLDYETASKVALSKRFIFLEHHLLMDDVKADKIERTDELMTKSGIEFLEDRFGSKYEYLKNQTSRRFIKTHLPLPLMPRKIKEVGAKVIYVARNPKDVAVSYFHFLNNSFKHDFETFSDFFLNGQVYFGSYWNHVLEGWNSRHDENVHFVFYENLKLDLPDCLHKLSEFLEKPLKAESMSKLIDYVSIENFRNNGAVNILIQSRLIRKGEIGGNPEMKDEISRKFDEMEKLMLGHSGIVFPSKNSSTS